VFQILNFAVLHDPCESSRRWDVQQLREKVLKLRKVQDWRFSGAFQTLHGQITG